jgi:hypothetical protein
MPIVLALVTLSVVVGAMAGCSSDTKSALVGAWVQRSAGLPGLPDSLQTWEFFRDGTFTSLTSSGGSDGTKATLKWSLISKEDAPVIHLEMESGDTFDYFYELQGDRLFTAASKEGLSTVLKLGNAASAFARVGSAADKEAQGTAAAAAAEAAKPVITSDGYVKITAQDEIDAIVSLDVNQPKAGTDGLYDLAGTIHNDSSWPVRVTSLQFEIGQVPQGFYQTWAIDAGGSQTFDLQNVNVNYGTDATGKITGLEVKK